MACCITMLAPTYVMETKTKNLLTEIKTKTRVSITNAALKGPSRTGNLHRCTNFASWCK